MGAVFVAVLGLVAVTATAAEDSASRLDRKVRVMERVLDEVLIQSPNVMVSSGGVTRGLVLDGYGALFTLDARVGTDYFMALPAAPLPPKPGEGTETEIIIAPRVRHRGDTGEIEVESWDEWREESKEKHAEQYKEFKSELIDALIDYGATLTELANDDWVAVAAFLDSRVLFRGSEGLFGGGGGGRLVVKVKMGDLRKYASGSLSRDAVIGKVVIEEK
jgi:hypothetical protein